MFHFNSAKKGHVIKNLLTLSVRRVITGKSQTEALMHYDSVKLTHYIIKVSCLVHCFVLHVGSLRRHGNKNVKNMTGLIGSVAIKSFCGSLIFSHFVQSPFERIAD